MATTAVKPGVKTVEQIIKAYPGITSKEIARQFDPEPDDKLRTTVAAVAWQLVTRKADTFSRIKDDKGVMRYYAPGANGDVAVDPKPQRQYKKRSQATPLTAPIGSYDNPATTMDELREAAQRPEIAAQKSQPLDIETALRDYVWDTGADPKPLHDFLDWYQAQA